MRSSKQLPGVSNGTEGLREARSRGSAWEKCKRTPLWSKTVQRRTEKQGSFVGRAASRQIKRVTVILACTWRDSHPQGRQQHRHDFIKLEVGRCATGVSHR